MLTLIDLLVHSYENQSIYLLSTNTNSIKLPSINLDKIEDKNNIDIDFLIKQLYDKYINLDYNWTKPSLLDIDLYQSQEDILQTHIYYSCYVPHSTVLLSGNWMIADEILPHSKILKKALLC